MRKIEPPLTGEYLPYAIAYISKVKDTGLELDHLQQHYSIMYSLIKGLPEEKLNFRYAEGKWNLKEMLVHIMDTERIFGYRALCIARNDKNALPGFEQDDYVLASNASNRSIDTILDEYATVRASTISLLNSFEDAVWTRMGTANNHPVSVRALAYQIVGHELHHLDIIRDRYL